MQAVAPATADGGAGPAVPVRAAAVCAAALFTRAQRAAVPVVREYSQERKSKRWGDGLAAPAAGILPPARPAARCGTRR